MRQLGRIARRAQLAATRRPPPPRGLRPALFCLAILLSLGTLAVLGVRFEAPAHARAWLDARLIALADRSGMHVREILVAGRERTAKADIVQKVDYLYMQNILKVDIARLKAGVEVLPWVKSATVKRQLPATLVIDVDEHRPLALWQDGGGAVRLVSGAGEAIDVPDALGDRGLPLLSGAGAPAAAPALFAALGGEPGLAGRVSGAQRLPDGRWNVFVDGAVEVRLPRRGVAAAWHRLALEEGRSRVLDRAIQAVDLRSKAWLVLKPLDEGVTPVGQAT